MKGWDSAESLSQITFQEAIMQRHPRLSPSPLLKQLAIADQLNDYSSYFIIIIDLLLETE